MLHVYEDCIEVWISVCLAEQSYEAQRLSTLNYRHLNVAIHGVIAILFHASSPRGLIKLGVAPRRPVGFQKPHLSFPAGQEFIPVCGVEPIRNPG